ncbi:MAG: phage tail protein [Candidatus Margulisiibacteriota bacterium]
MPSRLIDLDIHEGEINQVIEDLAATPAQVEKAMTSTVNRMARWLKTQSARGLSTHLQIPQSILRRRLKNFRLRKSPGTTEMNVWYGLNPVSFIRLKPKQTVSGVQAGRHSVEGGFIASGKSGNRHVFKRRGSKRLPIDAQYLDIEDQAVVFIDDHLMGSSNFDTVFLETFERELAWRTQTQK